VNEPDEDNLAREPTVSPEAVDEPPKRGRGRPKGYAKTGGRVRGKVPHQRYDDLEAHTVLGSMMADVVAFHYAVMRGETKATFNGPTGKPIERFPNLPERQKSADWLSENFWRLDEKLKAGAPTAKADPVEEADPDALRKAVLDDLVAHMLAQATPPPVDDTLSQIICVTDPKLIAEHDRTIAAGETPKPRKDPDRLDLGEGFFALRDIDRATGRERWACFNERNEHCCYKSSPEAARHWFENGTSAGLALKERRSA
jgi:hypothetical protein